MQLLSGLEYILVAIANAYGNGMDKKVWNERIAWARTVINATNKKGLFATADEPLLMRNALNAYHDACVGKRSSCFRNGST